MADPRPDSYANSDLIIPANTPLGLPSEFLSDSLDPPRASFLAPSDSNARNSYATSAAAASVSPDTSSALLSAPVKDETDLNHPTDIDDTSIPLARKRSRILILFLTIVVIIILALAVVLPVYFVVIKPKHHTTSAASSSSSSGTTTTGTAPRPSATPGSSHNAISGGDGSIILTEDGTTFIYNNSFSGIWYSDPNDPFNNNAYPNSWTPPLNTSWTWGKDRVFGVNLGGLFVLEPFITPALYEKYPGAVDEWTLSTLMAADTSPGGGLSQIEDHYKTFVTEQDIAQIAGAGLNWIRLPIPFWAIETWDGEPFLAKTSWKYILKIFAWARKYGIRVNLDLHTIPGSQNGFNHSGKQGQINFLNGIMGVANAQRTLNYIRIITEFISQSEYKDVVPVFSIINEALLSAIGTEAITSFYIDAQNMIRNITGTGAGNGPYIAIHDGFLGLATWAGYLPGSDRLILDTHPYFAFGGGANTNPVATGTGIDAGGVWPQLACSTWAAGINTSSVAFGVTIAGEFSNGINDCGIFLNGVPGSHSYGGDCSLWQDSSTWNQSVKAGVQEFALASMDALQDWFFWTWKIANATSTTVVGSPLWSYQLGLLEGWMPTDPRTASGTCQALGVSGPIFNGQYQSWQTGGAGAGTIAPSATVGFAWPPTSIPGVGGANPDLLPIYTSTGTVATLPPPTLTASATASINVGNGWFDAADTASAPTAISGCVYPNAWAAESLAVPVTACGATATTTV